MATDEYPYLTQLSVPDRLRLAAYEARDHGGPAIHLMAILDVAEGWRDFAAEGRNGSTARLWRGERP